MFKDAVFGLRQFLATENRLKLKENQCLSLSGKTAEILLKYCRYKECLISFSSFILSHSVVFIKKINVLGLLC